MSGKICAIDEEKRTILQTRTRQAKNKIQSSDRLQIIAYLGLTQCEKCLFSVKLGNGEIEHEMVEFDEEMFDKVCENIKNFVLRARTLTQDDFKKLID